MMRNYTSKLLKDFTPEDKAKATALLDRKFPEFIGINDLTVEELILDYPNDKFLSAFNSQMRWHMEIREIIKPYLD